MAARLKKPAVKAVTLTNQPPGLAGLPTRVLIEGEVQEPGRERTARFLTIAPNYFNVMEIPVLRDSIWFDIDLGGRVNVDSIKDQLDFFTRAGLVQGSVDVDRLVDQSYLPRR